MAHAHHFSDRLVALPQGDRGLLNCMSAVQYAVEVLGIRHVIVTGHYGCGAVNASMEDMAHGPPFCRLKPVATTPRSRLRGLRLIATTPGPRKHRPSAIIYCSSASFLSARAEQGESQTGKDQPHSPTLS